MTTRRCNVWSALAGQRMRTRLWRLTHSSSTATTTASNGNRQGRQHRKDKKRRVFCVEPPFRSFGSTDRTHNCFARTSVGVRGVRRECAMRSCSSASANSFRRSSTFLVAFSRRRCPSRILVCSGRCCRKALQLGTPLRDLDVVWPSTLRSSWISVPKRSRIAAVLCGSLPLPSPWSNSTVEPRLNVGPDGATLAPLIALKLFAKSEKSNLFDMRIQTARYWGVEPSATAGLSLNAAASRNVSYDSPFTAVELSAMKPWLVRPARATVGLSLCADAIHDVSYAFPFNALELSAH